MSFSFAQPGAAAPTTQPAAFGFGAAAPAAAQPAFGAYGAAQPAASAAPAFGQTTAAPAFGAVGAAPAFGAPGATPGFGAAAPAFGAAAGAAKPAFGAFGAPAATSAAPAFGSSFGGGFGTAAAPAASAGGFGAFGKPAGATGGMFGAAQPGIGATSTYGGSTFGGAYGQSAAGGAFGAIGQQQQQQQQLQQQQQQQQNPVERLYHAVLHCSLFGDERDTLLARWNMLQASWGVGKAFHSAQAPPVELTADNPLCRFKTLGYSRLPAHKNEDGRMGAVIKKKAAELEAQKPQIEQGLHGVLGNKPNMNVVVESIKALSGDASSEVVFHVLESGPAQGQTRKIPAAEINNFFSQPMQVQNLQRQGFENVSPKLSFTQKQIKEYLESPPQGIDPRLWKQAQLNNPDPKTLIPVPMTGFKDLQQRIQCQDGQAKVYQGRLDQIAEEISDLQKRHQDTLAKMRDAKRRQLSLAHRTLHVLVKQEETRKIGFTIQPEEEKLRIQLEALQSEMSAPTQFKGRLNELLSQVRHKAQVTALSGCSEKYTLDPFLQADLKSVLRQQQDGIHALMEVIKTDLADVEQLTGALQTEAAKKQKQF